MFQNRRSFAAAILGAALAQSTDITAAAAGTYNLDINHTAVVARVPHAGFSYEIFRFTPTAGQLVWNPASPTSSQVNVTVSTTSIQTPITAFRPSRAHAS